MTNVSTPSAAPAPLDPGSPRLAFQPGASADPSFVDMLMQCSNLSPMEGHAVAVVDGMATELHHSVSFPLFEPFTLMVNGGQPAEGGDLAETEPKDFQGEPGTPMDSVGLVTDQPIPVVPPAQTIGALVANPLAELPGVPASQDVLPEGESIRPDRTGSPAPAEIKAEAVAATAPAAAPADSTTAAPPVTTDVQLSPAPQPTVSQAAAALPPERSQALAAHSHVPSPPAAPMRQVMPFIASIASSEDGAPQTLVIRLEPTELGRLQVEIERTAEGLSRIMLQAERPDTLQLLMRDQPQLHRALDSAGVPADGRLLQFQLAPDQPPSLQGSAQFGTSGSPGGFANSNNGSARQHPDRHGGYAFAPSTDLPPVENRRRAGIDITA